jgi:Uma2 family endonuclease
MRTATAISVEEYLASDYQPDREYLEGELKERNLGEYDHSRPQSLLLSYFIGLEKKLGLVALVEQRVQVKAKRFWIPDLCLLRAEAPREQIIVTPPVLAVEVLSREDRVRDVQDRVDDFLEMGIAMVWVIDPKKRRAWIHTAEGVAEAKGGVLRGPGFEVPMAALFDS